ncbi:hypothetical protein [Marinoscillum pacificum]|uniref:hypothetical protein n=1 Tax=Marinoscillum pacificum TaxID=392723 RepID=UPI002158295E|nr:hypothetical protein [Marinoscillum pacificum]
MKTITTQELDLLKDHLIKKPFKYQEVFLEVLDHYATAYEQSEDSLEETIVKTDRVFPNARIEDINARYIKDLIRQMRKAHFTFFTNFFRWPQLLTTVLIVILFMLAAPIIHEYKAIKLTIFLGLAFVPFVLTIYVGVKSFRKRREYPGKLKNGHYNAMSIFLIIALNYMQINSFFRFFSDTENANMLEISPYWTAGFLLIGLALCSTTIQLFNAKVKPNMV